MAMALLVRLCHTEAAFTPRLAASVHATAALSLEPCPDGSARTCPDGSLFSTDAHAAHCGGELATCVPIAMQFCEHRDVGGAVDM